MSAATRDKDARKSVGRNTPGRRGRTGNQYFDVGKVGRKTGIVLIDTGVRDEYGMEPMSGIFSSPTSPEKQAQGTSSSHAMDLQESSAPDVDETLHMRKTPRLPPARASTPRHTNIGSPKRMSSARPQSRSANVNMASDISPQRAATQPPANRVLNFNRQNVRADTGSPFKPTRVLRRSFGGAPQERSDEDIPTSNYSKPELPTMENEVIQADADDYSDDDDVGGGAEVYMDEAHDEKQHQPEDQFANDAPIMFNDDEDYYDTRDDAHDADITQAMEHAEAVLSTTPSATPSKNPGGRPRKSINSSTVHRSPQGASTTSSRKRSRQQIEENEDNDANETMQSIEQSQNDVSHVEASSSNPAKRPRGRPPKNRISVLQDSTVIDPDQSLQSIEQDDNEASQISTTADNAQKKARGRPRKSDVTIVHDNTEQAIDATNIAHGDSYLAPVDENDEAEVAPASPVTKGKGGRKPKAQKATKSKKAPKERDPNQSMRRTPSASPGKADRDRKLNITTPSKRMGSVSNVNLRASTPFEDAHQRMSRSGRPILAPLKHWAGESYVWKNGEVEGIIRADEVKTSTGSKKKRKSKTTRRTGKRGGNNELGMIAEESDTESTVPDDWEEQVGVIAGTVAAWDPDAQQGNPEDPIREDIAFASSSIVTRDVAGSAFQYAKIMTLPFFGSGIVELPPEGFKRAKNSRKMQMVFFVHVGKVLVTVGPPAIEQNGVNDAETNEFAISKGGVWVVPRGNNYSIANESATKSARIFFAQGCEVEPESSSSQE